MEISEKEVLRYLGYRGAAADERILEQIRQISTELAACVRPRNVYGIWDCRVNPPRVAMGGLDIKSGSLAGHLDGCEQVALLAATLGAGADELIRRYSVREMEKAAVAGAVCASMIEAYCDEIEKEIAQKADELHLTARFSPGYGDFDMTHQKDIWKLLDCGRRIGLMMTEGAMLVPSKSVIAVIGFSPVKRCVKRKCESCNDRQCEFREAT